MQQMFFLISRKMVVFRLFSFFVLFLFLFAVIESPHARAEPTDANPIQNSDFESDSISFWEKWPSNAPGTIGVDARANKTPRGTLSAFIEPNNANVNTQMQQNLSVTGGKTYRLQVWVTTNGMTAYVEYWSNVGGNVVCGQTSVVYPTWSFISCNLTVPSGTTAFNVHIRGRAAAGKWMVSDDWFLVDPTGGVPGYFHAQRVKTGTFKGVRATIKVPNPKLREAGRSFVSIRIIGGTKNMELGVNRENFFQQCVQKFLYAVQQNGTDLDSPLPDGGTKYIFTITHLFDDSWWFRITNTDGSIMYEKQVVGTGMTQGDQIQVTGEVTGREGTNDLGESPLMSLQYRHPTNGWQSWNGYVDSVMDSPFVIKGITSDPNNNLFVYGNNKSPVPADAPCP